ncbi:MAG: AraC family transcriptional regulator [Rhodovibrionaceae bacterium]|nr:AraC family transcriptional regulator [Rhodovibrionaceae bacterium]
MDVLNDILDTLDLKGVLYFRTDFSPPWAVTVPDHENAARFHLVVQGTCHVEAASGQTAELGPGDLALIARGRSHVIADSTGRSAAPLENVLAETGYANEGVLVLGDGDPNAATQMICGHFSFRGGADHPILRALPDLLVTTTSMRARQPWLDELLRLVAQRMFSGEIGSQAAVTRLSEIVFIELLRAGIDQSPELQSMIEGFRDKQIGHALQLMHAEPSHPWTVARLAAAVGMSRSRFADRFNQLVGMGPMAYLSNWRLQKALSLLEGPRCNVQQIAVQTGYSSASAFTRAFSEKFGIPPTRYRRETA